MPYLRHGLTGYLKMFETNKKRQKSDRSNIKLDFQLSKKISSNVYYALGGYVSSNHLGFDNLKQYTLLSDDSNSHSKIFAKMGFIINNQNGIDNSVILNKKILLRLNL